MDTIKKFWTETMDIPEARWIVAISGLVICVAVAFYFVKLFRDMALGNAEDRTGYLTDFQRLRDEGKLDEEEYSRLSKAIPKEVLPEVGDQSKQSD